MMDHQTLEFFSPTLPDILGGLAVSLLCSVVIAIVYRYTYHGPGYARGYITSLVVLSLITTLVIIVIGNNLARAFGLVGALSIIRFRTAVKDTLDIVYIFFGLAVGMAAGVGYHKVALAGTLTICVVLIAASRTSLGVFGREEFLLQFRYADEQLSAVKKTMEQHCTSFEWISMRSPTADGPREASFYVTLKRKRGHPELLVDLHRLSSVSNVHLYRDEERV